jgi:hypothetical protein
MWGDLTAIADRCHNAKNWVEGCLATTLGQWLVTVTGRVVSKSRSIPSGLLPIVPSGPLAVVRPVYLVLSVCVALSQVMRLGFP